VQIGSGDVATQRHAVCIRRRIGTCRRLDARLLFDVGINDLGVWDSYALETALTSGHHAIEALAGAKGPDRAARVVCLTPQGQPLDQERLAEMAVGPPLLLVCGRYEGVDQRILDLAVDEEVSIGDYVLSGGEVPAMVLVEGIVRLLPGVLGNPESIQTESFQGGAVLEGPQYTRPPLYRGLSVPEILRSGDHAAIDDWRRKNAQARTRERRPDLLEKARSGKPMDPRE
jgi:tRNA (guanine37-N1)-methyltransferase